MGMLLCCCCFEKRLFSAASASASASASAPAPAFGSCIGFGFDFGTSSAAAAPWAQNETRDEGVGLAHPHRGGTAALRVARACIGIFARFNRVGMKVGRSEVGIVVR